MNGEITLAFIASQVIEPFAAVAALVTALFIGLSLVSIISDALAGSRKGE